MPFNVALIAHHLSTDQYADQITDQAHACQKRKPPQTNVRAFTADGTLTDMDGQFV